MPRLSVGKLATVTIGFRLTIKLLYTRFIRYSRHLTALHTWDRNTTEPRHDNQAVPCRLPLVPSHVGYGAAFAACVHVKCAQQQRYATRRAAA